MPTEIKTACLEIANHVIKHQRWVEGAEEHRAVVVLKNVSPANEL